jgi:hypothetical protein
MALDMVYMVTVREGVPGMRASDVMGKTVHRA